MTKDRFFKILVCVTPKAFCLDYQAVMLAYVIPFSYCKLIPIQNPPVSKTGGS
jgi:hypothetical protein